MMDAKRQNQLIVEQFSVQAAPFAKLAAHSTEDSLRLAREAVELDESDTVLDVACGPGIVACDFARHARRVAGIDLTPAMIEQAQTLQAAKGLSNLEWRVGDVVELPFDSSSFSVVFTRYSFHHMLEPDRVLAEMARVAKPGGRVAVVDVYSSGPEQAAAYDHAEKLRDPSHVRALGLGELAGLFEKAGLEDVKVSFYGVDVDLDELLGSSAPEPGAADEVRRIFREDVGVDRLGVNARWADGSLQFTFPIAVLVGRKAEA
ncbi:class I SAM-dependent methyltransferase [Paludisphaera borealis]|nr:methyltransferase domain-containing protein [Paludisphaera borealis]